MVQPSASSPAAPNERGPFIAPISSGMRSCTGRAAVNRPVYWKKSPSKSILPSSRNVRMTWSASLSRESGFWLLPVEVVLRHQAEVAGGDDALRAPARELVERGELLADQRRLAQEDVRDVRAEADALGLVGRGGEQDHRSLCQVSSTA